VLRTRSLLRIFGTAKMLILAGCQNGASKLKSIVATIGVTFSGYESEVTQLLFRIKKNSIGCGCQIRVCKEHLRQLEGKKRIKKA